MRWPHDYSNCIHTSTIHQTTAILGYRSRTFLWAWLRGRTLTQSCIPRLGSLAGASGLPIMLNVFKYRFFIFIRITWISIRRGQTEEGAEVPRDTFDPSISLMVWTTDAYLYGMVGAGYSKPARVRGALDDSVVLSWAMP